MELAAALVAAGLVLAMLAPLVNKVLANQRRIERKLDQLLAHAGLAAEPAVSPEVIQLATTFRLAEAIKLYRQQTGADLGEAKAAIDAAIANQRRGTAPATTPEGPAPGS